MGQGLLTSPFSELSAGFEVSLGGTEVEAFARVAPRPGEQDAMSVPL